MDKAGESKKLDKQEAMTRITVMVTNYLSSFSSPKDLDCYLNLRAAKA